jgi:hypothetical protein
LSGRNRTKTIKNVSALLFRLFRHNSLRPLTTPESLRRYKARKARGRFADRPQVC